MNGKVDYINEKHIVYFSYSWNGGIREDSDVFCYIGKYLDKMGLAYDKSVILSQLNGVYANLENHIEPLQKQLRRFRIRFKFDKGLGVEQLCGWGDDIHSAENEIGDGDAIIVFVSRKYLMSPHTMKEWHSIVQKGNLIDRVYPICIDHPLRFKLNEGKVIDIAPDFYYNYISDLWNKSLQKLPPEYIKTQFNGSLDVFSEVTKKDLDVLFGVMQKNMDSINDIAKESYTKITSKFIHDFWPNFKHELITNVSRRSLFVPRKNCTDSLYDDLIKNQIVNLTAFGGYGKSFLVNLLTYSYNFDYVVRCYVKGKIKEDIVESLSKFIRKNINPNFDCKDKDNVFVAYEACIDQLDFVSKPYQNNLFVLDIDGDCSQYSSFFKSFHQEDSGLYPKGWRVLVVSRKPCFKDNPNYKLFNINNPIKIKNDVAYLKDLFEMISGYHHPNDGEIKTMIEKLSYSPLWVKIVAGNIKTKKNKPAVLISDIVNAANVAIQFDSDNINDYTDDKKMESTICEYFNRFVDFDNLPFNCRLLLSLFMIWHSNYVKTDVVYGLADKYVFEKFRRFFGLWVGRLEFDKDKPETHFLVKDALGHLTDMGLLDTENDGDSYALHSIIGQILRQKYLYNVNNQIERYRNYNRYVLNCDLHYRDKDYFDCIYSSIMYDGSEHYIDDSQSRIFGGIKKKTFFVNYVKERDMLKVIENIPKDNFVALAEKYYEFADFEEKIKSDAFPYYIKSYDNYKKILDIVDCQKVLFAVVCCRLGCLTGNVDYYSEADALCNNLKDFKGDVQNIAALKCMAAFVQDSCYDTPSDALLAVYNECFECLDTINFDDSAFLIFVKANLYCRLADSFFNNDNDKAYDLYDKSVKQFSKTANLPLFAKKNKADANYRYAFLIERRQSFEYDYNNKESLKESFFNWKQVKEDTNKYFAVADKIWKSLSPENEGLLKGFVITSYGIYDPRIDYKLVKVLPGHFEMGMTEEEYREVESECKKNLVGVGLDLVLKYIKSAVPTRCVNIEYPFYIGMYPITKGQWFDGRFDDTVLELNVPKYEDMKKEGQALEVKYSQMVEGAKKLKYIIVGGEDDGNAMNYVSFNDANQYIGEVNSRLLLPVNNNLKYRLPSESEWEYAARGGDKSKQRYQYSGSNSVYDVAFHGRGMEYSGNIEDVITLSGVGPALVGSFKPNELGIYDMSGNVWEWCQDLYESSGSSRVLRGGSWYNHAGDCRVSNRDDDDPDGRNDGYGMRLALPCSPFPS